MGKCEVPFKCVSVVIIHDTALFFYLTSKLIVWKKKFNEGTLGSFHFMVMPLRRFHCIEIGCSCCFKGYLVIPIFLNLFLIVMYLITEAARYPCPLTTEHPCYLMLPPVQHNPLIRRPIYWALYLNFVFQVSPIQSLVGQTGKKWVMGLISQLEDGHFYLEDMTAAVEVDLTNAISFPIPLNAYLIYAFLVVLMEGLTLESVVFGCLFSSTFVSIFKTIIYLGACSMTPNNWFKLLIQR